MAQSDFIVLAVPLTNETKHMINKETIGKMKSNAIVVNVGRGGKKDLLQLGPSAATGILTCIAE